MLGREVGARGVDLLEQRLRREADGELAGRLDVAQRVLPADRGELDDGRVDARHRVEGVRRQVQHALGRAAAHPGDGPGHDDRVQHPVEGPRLHVVRVEVDAVGAGRDHVLIVAGPGSPGGAAGPSRVHPAGPAAPGQGAAPVPGHRAHHEDVEGSDRRGVRQDVGPDAAARAPCHRGPADHPRGVATAPAREPRSAASGGSTHTAVRAAAAARPAAGEPPTDAQSDLP